MDGEIGQGLVQTLRVALSELLLLCSWEWFATIAVSAHRLPQELHSDFQHVGLLRLGIRLQQLELLLQNFAQLIDAAVNAISAHLLHRWLPYPILLLGGELVFGILRGDQAGSGIDSHDH